MSIISATKLNKNYGVVPALTDVTFNINKGDHIGIVGANGAGKSTLIKILARELPYDSGDLFFDKDISVGYLKQRDHFPGGGTVEGEMLGIFRWQIQAENDLAALTRQIAENSKDGKDVEELLSRYDALSSEFSDKRGYSFRSEIRGILSSLAFGEEYLDKPVELLSGGERTRLALAALLLKEPDVLLLDEPTNHLDIGTLKWLEHFLKAYKGTLVIISHDRYFLDRTVKRIFEIENTELTAYDGNYTEYKEKKELLFQDRLRQYENTMAEIERQEEIIRRFKGHNTEKLVKRAQSREKRLAHMDRPDKPVEFKEKLNISFKEKLASGNDVLYASDLAMSFGDGENKRQLFENVNMDIKKGDRICIVGPNGIGKTTLLKIILGSLEPDKGFVRLGQNVMPGYYDQEQKLLNMENTVLDEVHSTYRLYDQTELRSLLGRFMFHGDDVFKKVNDLAGGEKAKLSLLKLMLSGANLLIMDEPTNHLDIKAKEVFEDALLSFPGTLLLVSHDRYLLTKVPTAIYELGPDGIRVFLGGYDYYTEKSEELGSGKAYLNKMSKDVAAEVQLTKEELKEKEKQQRALERQKEKAEAAEQRRREKQLAAAELAVSRGEALVDELTAELCKESVYTDPQMSAEISKKLEAAKASLEEKYNEWILLQ